MVRIIKYDRSVIVACDVKTIGEFKKLIERTYSVEGIGGYKIGSILTICYGLPILVNTVREFTNLPIIYDHQKAMTDIHELGRNFAEVVKKAGADALIGFPQSGPATEEFWISSCRDVGLEVIVGGEMTHPKYKRSEGGYIADDALDEIYKLAARFEVNNFVVPGNKVEKVIHYRTLLQPIVHGKLTLYAPGFVAQGGSITNIAKAAGDSWHAIVGRAIYRAKDITQAAKEMTSQLSR